MTRLRVDYTGINGTLFLMGKRNSEKCGNCGVKENAEHIILYCTLMRWKERCLKIRFSRQGGNEIW